MSIFKAEIPSETGLGFNSAYAIINTTHINPNYIDQSRLRPYLYNFYYNNKKTKGHIYDEDRANMILEDFEDKSLPDTSFSDHRQIAEIGMRRGSMLFTLYCVIRGAKVSNNLISYKVEADGRLFTSRIQALDYIHGEKIHMLEAEIQELKEIVKSLRQQLVKKSIIDDI